MQIFHTENKQTGQLNFLFFGHFDQKTKNEKCNEPDNYGKEIFHRYLLLVFTVCKMRKYIFFEIQLN